MIALARVSYSGYYPSFPSWRWRFDSAHPLHFVFSPWHLVMKPSQRLGIALITLAVTLSVTPASAPLAQTPGNNQPLPSLAPVVEQVLPTVVNIETFARVRVGGSIFDHPFWGRSTPPRTERRMRSAGSGVIIDAGHGYVLTNYHVIEAAEEIQINLEDRRELTAGVVGFDKEVDLAVLQVDADNLKQIERGNSDALAVGDFVLAIGNPFRFDSTVTSGIVSALGRGSSQSGYQDFIQTDASINSGNSGGPLVDLGGKLVGINTAIFAPGGGSVGIGFAIPSNLAMGIAQELIASGTVRRGRLGFWVQDLSTEERTALGIFDREGVRVRAVTPGGTADSAGVQAGDVLIEIEGRPIRDASDYASSAGLFIIGQDINLELSRDGRRYRVEVRIKPLSSKPVEGGRVDIRLAETTLQNFLDQDEQDTNSLGILITDIKRTSYAWQSGVRAGDILTSANRARVRSIDDLMRELDGSWQDLVIGVYRSGTRGSITLRALKGA